MPDREKLIELLAQCSPPNMRVCSVDGDRITLSISQGKIADHLISHGVTVRERGRWEQVDHDGSWRVDRCSICHRRMHYVDYDQPYQYCPNCGADMRGE